MVRFHQVPITSLLISEMRVVLSWERCAGLTIEGEIILKS